MFSVLIGSFSHIISDMFGTNGVMLFFPASTMKFGFFKLKEHGKAWLVSYVSSPFLFVELFVYSMAIILALGLVAPPFSLMYLASQVYLTIVVFQCLFFPSVVAFVTFRIVGVDGLRGILRNKSRRELFTRSYFGPNTVCIVALSLLLWVSGIYRLDVRYVVMLFFLVPCVSGALFSTQTGIQTGLYGGIFGSFLYAVVHEGVGFYLDHLWWFFPVTMFGWLSGWSGGSIVHGQTKHSVMCTVIEFDYNRIGELEDITAALKANIGAVYEANFSRGPSVKNTELESSQYRTQKSVYRVSREEIEFTHKLFKPGTIVKTAILRDRYYSPSQILDYITAFFTFKMKTVVTVSASESLFLIIKSYNETASFIWASRDSRLIHEMLIESTKERLAEFAPVVVGEPFIEVIMSHKKKLECFIKVPPQEEAKSIVCEENRKVAEIIQPCLIESTLMNKVREYSFSQVIDLLKDLVLLLVLPYILGYLLTYSYSLS